jgi:hypothetical protein
MLFPSFLFSTHLCDKHEHSLQPKRQCFCTTRDEGPLCPSQYQRDGTQYVSQESTMDSYSLHLTNISPALLRHVVVAIHIGLKRIPPNKYEPSTRVMSYTKEAKVDT